MINTYSKFYYSNKVDGNNLYLDFDEGSGSLFATVEVGSKTPTTLATAVANALNAAGGLVYTVTYNRANRTYTISSTSNFTLLISTGVHVGTDIFSTIGFTGSDLSGASTYTGVAAGFMYEPQFKLQDYVSSDDFQKSISPTVNKSASGIIEVVKFGTEKFFEFNIMFATDIDQGPSGPIKTNLSGVSSLRSFLQFLVSKEEIEFMPNSDDPDTFVTVLLESTEEDKDGTGYRLKEMYSKNLPYYYETGKLVFRLVD